MLWICRGCTAAYAVGAPACPQCGGSDYVEDWKMPKISKGDGPSYEPEHAPDWTADQGPVPEPSTAAATEPEAAVTEPEPQPAPAPAPKPAKG